MANLITEIKKALNIQCDSKTAMNIAAKCPIRTINNKDFLVVTAHRHTHESAQKEVLIRIESEQVTFEEIELQLHLPLIQVA